MSTFNDKPLFSLTVGEYAELNRKLYQEFVAESHKADEAAAKQPVGFLKEILNIDEVAELTGYARQTLYGLVSAGRIPYIKRPGSKFLRFKRTEVEAWMTSNKIISKGVCNKLKTKAI